MCITTIHISLQESSIFQLPFINEFLKKKTNHNFDFTSPCTHASTFFFSLKKKPRHIRCVCSLEAVLRKVNFLKVILPILNLKVVLLFVWFFLLLSCENLSFSNFTQKLEHGVATMLHLSHDKITLQTFPVLLRNLC